MQHTVILTELVVEPLLVAVRPLPLFQEAGLAVQPPQETAFSWASALA